MSEVFELGGKSIFVTGNHLFLVDEQLEVVQYKVNFIFNTQWRTVYKYILRFAGTFLCRLSLYCPID